MRRADNAVGAQKANLIDTPWGGLGRMGRIFCMRTIRVCAHIETNGNMCPIRPIRPHGFVRSAVSLVLPLL